MKKYQQNIALLLISFCFALVLGELFLRMITPSQKYMIHEPNITKDFKNSRNFLPGVDEHIKWTTNSQGYRGLSKFDSSRFGIMAIGGSTTECSVIDQDKTWCSLLEQKLNLELDSIQVTIGNFGKSGLNTAHHLLQLQYLPSQFENIQAIILLVGINDYLRALDMEQDYFPAKEDEKLFKKTFAQFPLYHNDKFYQRTAWWSLLRKVKQNFLNKTNDKSMEAFEAKIEAERNAFYTAIKNDTLLNMSIPLSHYEQNLRAIASLSKKNKWNMVWLTQSVLWNSNMDSFELALSVRPSQRAKRKYYTPNALQNGMKLYNDCLRKVALEEQIPIVDLATLLARDTSVFYDYCHYNQGGNETISEQVFSVLLETIRQEN